MTTTNKKAAPAEAAENTATSDTCNYITVLDTVGDPLTTFYRDGQRCINDAFNGASTVRKCLVENLSDVAELLDELHREPLSCIVQGAYVGDGNLCGYIRAGSESVDSLLGERVAQTIDGIDCLTVLETFGPCLTKIYKSDGTTEAYGDAASFKVKTVEVANLPALATLLGKLHKNKKRCLIAGAPKDEMQPGNVQGSVTRTNANFDDQPLHSFVIDIDGYRPGFADPILETELAVLDFLAEKLPACFRTASFYWHLSSSAGMPGKEGILKCHLWMWSKTAYTTAQMYEWAKAYTPAIDKAVYRRVQIRYTADPIFEEGRTDPVATTLR